MFQNCGGAMRAPPGQSTSSSLDTKSSASGIYSASLQSSAVETISPEQQAQDLYRRLAGTTVSANDATYTQMVDFIKSGQRRKAAELAIQTKDFYHITVRDFAGRMATRESNTLAPLSDFIATVIGVTRDNAPATDLLTANYYYRAVGESGVSQDLEKDIVTSNKHYELLESLNVNLVNALKKENGQKIRTPAGAVGILEDAAGLLTSRAYMMAHANQGTNRRMIEYAFKNFLCVNIEEWASTTNADDFIGRDIGRHPIAEYNNKCKGCHTGMDGMRPATAHFDYEMLDETANLGYLKYKYSFPTDPDPVDAALTVPVPSDQQLIPSKFRRGSSIYQYGYVVKNNQWRNYASTTSFGWNTETAGQGMNDLGQMIAFSDGFPRCMAKRVFSAVCKYELGGADAALINKLAVDFKYKGYSLKELFLDVALRPECLGVQ